MGLKKIFNHDALNVWEKNIFFYHELFLKKKKQVIYSKTEINAGIIYEYDRN